MKRQGGLYPRIMEYENLRLAFYKAARGKALKPEVIAYRSNLDARLEALRSQLADERPDIGHYRFFQVHDPKPRNICAAAFPERVLHHAVMNVCEPLLETAAVYDTYACRKGKGSRKALDRACCFAGKHAWYLKLDIRKYFDSVDHGITMNLLERRIKDGPLLDLFRTILDTYETAPNKGLPIGNLISQHLANFYLGPLDRFVKERLHVKGYLRYMDDFVLFAREKGFLKDALEAVRRFLGETLDLRLKDNVQLNRTAKGLPFLGYRVFPHRVDLAPARLRRFVRKFRAYERNHAGGSWTEADLVRHMEPLIDFTRAADARGFRMAVMNRHGVLS